MRTHMRRLILSSLLALPALPASLLAQDGTALRIHSGWTHASVPAQKSAMVYFTLENPGPKDRLISASSAAAESVHVHEFAVDEGGNRMQEVDSVEVTAQSRRDFDRDCYHLMLTGLKRPLRIGETIKVALRFERAGTVELPVSVRPRDYRPAARAGAAR